MTKPVILTGIRANNDLHIGNYFGALLPIVDMAKGRSSDYQINLFVPDLHSFTTPIDHRALHDQILHNVRLFAAAGLPLDHPDIHIYRQSYVPAHSELTWILDCFTGFGEMSRMTQFKDKSAKYDKQSADSSAKLEESVGNQKGAPSLYYDGKNYVPQQPTHIADLANAKATRPGVSVGLFNYPVLMAADILLYDAQFVPVGDDQSQHLEFTRDIAERFNRQFADVFPDGIFVMPEPVAKQHAFFGKDQGLRIRDLQNPSKKMSKSDDSGKGIIFLGDSAEEAAKKIMGAATDSEGVIHYDQAKQPGLANLLQISALLAQRPVQEIAAAWEGKTSYGELKKAVADQVKTFLQGFQARLAAVDDQKLTAKLEASEAIMREVANAKLLQAQQAVGLRA